MKSQQKTKILIVRLSSLGDVVLSSAVWQNLPKNTEVHFLTSKGFGELFQSDPKLSRVWEFDRKSGFEGWKKIVSEIHDQRYDEIWDIHRTLRTRYLYWSFSKSSNKPQFRRLKKQKWRHFGYLWFRRFWPEAWMPKPKIQAYLETTDQPITNRPKIVLSDSIQKTASIGFMPDSKWPAKSLDTKWVIDYFKKENASLKLFGMESDQVSKRFAKAFDENKVKFENLIGSKSLTDVAKELAQCEWYFGADTGLAHIAEAVGTPVKMVFGPSSPKLGFGPWQAHSQTLEKGLFCQPCGKDGRNCYRLWNRYACQKSFSSEDLERSFGKKKKKVFFSFKVYRFICRAILSRQSIKRRSNVQIHSTPENGFDHYWFHGASAGECEALLPLIESFQSQANLQNQKVCFSLTTFSRSGLSVIERFKKSNPQFAQNLYYFGLSPIEGFWTSAFDLNPPKAFVSVKYEAWPELWASLWEHSCELHLINASDRPSLKWVKRILSLLKQPLPNLFFQTQDESEIEPLTRRFFSSSIQKQDDPRWDQIFKRANQENQTVKELAQTFSSSPRPWGVLGSLWSEDLVAIEKSLRDLKDTTLWVAPHKLNDQNISQLKAKLESMGFNVIDSNQDPEKVESSGKVAIMVRQMGVLAELYSIADWAFVGGGFTQNGVHNTMEPAVYGIPISAGASKANRFYEIQQLRKTKQLTLLREGKEFAQWIKNGEASSQSELRKVWKNELRRYKGASDRAAGEILQNR